MFYMFRLKVFSFENIFRCVWSDKHKSLKIAVLGPAVQASEVKER